MDDGSDFTDTDIDSVLADDECIYYYYYFEIYFILIPNWLDITQEPLFQSGFNVLQQVQLDFSEGNHVDAMQEKSMLNICLLELMYISY
jgi:hypothetical protein